ncbi:MAG: M15 family metallopeptidase [Cellvibrionaceae bacterium]
MVTVESVLGLDNRAISESAEFKCPLHDQVCGPLDKLREAARGAGLDLGVVSGYRSFERQLAIWNGKAQGLRPVLDSQGTPLDLSALSDREKVFAILRWSALPGASRHHWGTDVDVYDPSAVTEDYSIQLTVSETCDGGAFTKLHAWLDEQLSSGESDFYRPYDTDRGGVAPEPWHLSYRPLSSQYMGLLSLEALRGCVENQSLLLKETVLDNLEEIYTRFVVV